jgi:hypothetical protein
MRSSRPGTRGRTLAISFSGSGRSAAGARRTSLRARGWELAPAGALLLQLIALALGGLPATHDGFFHVAWIESFNYALYQEGVIARWYAEAFGGIGSATFVFYPPLFRLLSLPFGAFGANASALAAAAIGSVLVVHAYAAWRFLRLLSLSPASRALCLLLAILNPYLLTNVWIRGAWPEALALALLWCLAEAVWRLQHDEHRRGARIAALAFAGLLVCHHPTALLAACAAIPFALSLAWARRWVALRSLAVAAVAGALLAGFHLLPVVFDQDSIRLLTGDRLHAMQWTQWQADSNDFARSLSWIWLWLAVVAATSWVGLRAHVGNRAWGVPNAWVLSLSVLMMLPPAAELHAVLPQLGRIQFPWRWMTIATPAAIGLIALLAQGTARARAFALLLGLAGVASGVPSLRDVTFTPAAFASLDAMYRCERAHGDCSHFDAIEPLQDRSGELRYLSQHGSHHGPWVDAMGNLWRLDVYDYLPKAVWAPDWARTERGWRYMPPFPPRAQARIEPSAAARVIGERRGVHRWVVDLDVSAPAELTLERLRYPGWELRVRSGDGQYETVDPVAGSFYYRMLLDPGKHRVQLRQVGSPAERIGEATSLLAALALVIGSWRTRKRTAVPSVRGGTRT